MKILRERHLSSVKHKKTHPFDTSANFPYASFKRRFPFSSHTPPKYAENMESHNVISLMTLGEVLLMRRRLFKHD